jgi:hypothetical protein
MKFKDFGVVEELFASQSLRYYLLIRFLTKTRRFEI